MVGFLVIILFLLSFLVIFETIMSIRKEYLRRSQNRSGEDFAYTSEAIYWKDACESDFNKLVRIIAFRKLREANQRVGVVEDMKNAFLEAVKEVHLANANNSHSGAGAVQDRIRELIKKYETP